AAGPVPNKFFGFGKLDLTNVVPDIDTVAPTVTLTKPNGGETFIIGSQDTVRWNAADNFGVIAVDLEYSINNGTNWTPIVSGLVNNGKYLWLIPNSASGTAKVRVTAHDSQNVTLDASNAFFTISVGTPLAVPEAGLAFSVGAP